MNVYKSNAHTQSKNSNMAEIGWSSYNTISFQSAGYFSRHIIVCVVGTLLNAPCYLRLQETERICPGSPSSELADPFCGGKRETQSKLAAPREGNSGSLDHLGR